MMDWNRRDWQKELNRIQTFIRDYVMPEEQVVVAVSGGMDSDIVARLCCRSIGKENVRLFIVIQSDMEEKFLVNARDLAEELGVPLAEFHLEMMNEELMKTLETGESAPLFRTDMMLNLAKAKCSIRSAVLSSYQDKGFLIAGTTNRTEKELGFFLTFGDNLSHFKPLAHLYKSELRSLAELLGTAREVMDQEPSAGFWCGETDLEDIAYWIINDGPIVYPRHFSQEEDLLAEKIKGVLTQKKIDETLFFYRRQGNLDGVSDQVGLPQEIVAGLAHIVDKAKILKSRKILVELPEGGE